MPIKTWTLTDVERGVYVERFSIGPADVPGVPAHFEVTKRTLRGGLSDGVDVIEVDNGRIRFSVLPTRGMGLWRMTMLEGEHVGWKSPIRGPVHPQFVNLMDPSGLGWLDGFDELLCRCGLESNGAPEFDEQGRVKYPLHGKIANRPAHKVEIAYDGDVGEIVLRGVVDESRFHFQKLRLTTTIRTRPREFGLRIHDEVTNVGATPAGMQMLYHINFGGGLLDAGSKIVAPVKTLVPRNDRAVEGVKQWDHFAAEQPGYAEQVYFFELATDARGDTRTLLKNAHSTRGASVAFNAKTLPCFTLWKDTGAAADGYVTGLEPGTNYPNPRSHEQKHGRVVELAPGKSRSFDVALELHPDAKAVKEAEQAVARLQTGTRPTIHEKPQSGWCAGI